MVLDKRADYDAEAPAVPADRDVPVTLPLKDLGVVGIAGDAGAARGLARWLVAQAAALHSPRDLSIVVLSDDPQAAAHWNWVRWLPHCAPRTGADCVALVGGDPQTVAARVAELRGPGGRADAEPVPRRPAQRVRRFRRRAGFGASRRTAPAEAGPRTLVILDGARTLRRFPGMPQVLATARLSGISAVCIGETERELPEECAAVVSFDPRNPGYLAVRGTETTGLVLADQVSPGWADRVARSLAPLRDISREDGQAAIPASARLLDLLGLPDPSAEAVLARWQRYGRTTAVPIGIGADGPVTVDIRADGPHALIAGTTGAGKSELLQTLIASLAAANRPDAMTFVLIDYKGGSAFKDCARLPHTVGMVSDLDGHLTERALASLAAELRRREEILLHAGAKDIEDYWETAAGRRRPGAARRCPRLVLVIDEFASLVAELPDFVTGLVGIAQRGRSLGVHLILATQRPAGVVSADIRANTNLRIALRVTDAAESVDVIDAPDAARIAKSTPGRCYVRSGAAAPGRGAVGPDRRAAPRLRAGPAAGRPGRAGAVARARAAGLVRGSGRRAGAGRRRARDRPVGPGRRDRRRGPQARPGRAAQPVAGAAAGAAHAGRDPRSGRPRPVPGEVAPVPFGLTDVPARQAREPLTLDLAQGGHLVVAGAPRVGPVHGAAHHRRLGRGRRLPGGRAHLRDRLRLRLAAAAGPAAALRRGGQPGPDRPGRAAAGQAARPRSRRRQQLLAADGLRRAWPSSGRTPPTRQQRLPWMLLLLDWWEGYFAAFEQYDYGRLIESMLQMLREGAAVGLRAVVTTDRTALMGQVGTVFERRMVLGLADRDDASYAGHQRQRAMPGAPAAGPGHGRRPAARSRSRPRSRCSTPTRPGRPRSRRCGRLGRARRPGAFARPAAGAAAAAGRPAAGRGSPRTRHWRLEPGVRARRRRCGRWSGRAATSCGRRASTSGPTVPAWWSPARRAAAAPPRCSPWSARCCARARRCWWSRRAGRRCARWTGAPGVLAVLGARPKPDDISALVAGWTATWCWWTTPSCWRTARSRCRWRRSSSAGGTPSTA